MSKTVVGASAPISPEVNKAVQTQKAEQRVNDVSKSPKSSVDSIYTRKALNRETERRTQSPQDTNNPNLPVNEADEDNNDKSSKKTKDTEVPEGSPVREERQSSEESVEPKPEKKNKVKKREKPNAEPVSRENTESSDSEEADVSAEISDEKEVSGTVRMENDDFLSLYKNSTGSESSNNGYDPYRRIEELERQLGERKQQEPREDQGVDNQPEYSGVDVRTLSESDYKDYQTKETEKLTQRIYDRVKNEMEAERRADNEAMERRHSSQQAAAKFHRLASERGANDQEFKSRYELISQTAKSDPSFFDKAVTPTNLIGIGLSADDAAIIAAEYISDPSGVLSTVRGELRNGLENGRVSSRALQSLARYSGRLESKWAYKKGRR